MFPIKGDLKHVFFTIGFQLCFRICHKEGSGKPGWLEVKWYTSASSLADDVNILSGSDIL